MDKDRLALEVQCELEQLRSTAEQASRLFAVPANERREWDAIAGAKFVAEVWLGVENLCKRRYAVLGLASPQGSDSHARILGDFLADARLGGCFSADHVTRLKKYLAFRHRFIHGYGQQISWGMVEEPLRSLPEMVTILSRVWNDWLSTL